MGFTIIFALFILFLLFLIGFREELLIALVPCILAGLILSFVCTIVLSNSMPNEFIEKQVIYIDESSYKPSAYSSYSDTFSEVKDLKGKSYSFSYKYTPVFYDTDEPYLMIKKINKVGKFMFFNLADTYELHLTKKEEN